MNLFKNKFFLICLCVAVVLAVVPATLSVMGFHGLARNIVGTVTVPFRWLGTTVANGFEGFGRVFTSVSVLTRENDELRQENDRLKDRLDRAQILENENERLRAFLGMKEQYPSFTFRDGMVISREAENYMTVFTLNCGTVQGVRENMPVVTETGIVGFVTEAGLNWCKVSTIIETASSVGVYLPRSGVTGIASGDYSLRNNGYCKLNYLDGEDVEIGDLVLSSGEGSVYPAGLTVGRVHSVEYNEYSRQLTATVVPSVDFSTLKQMMVITNYEK